jgi:hypothetical protein
MKPHNGSPWSVGPRRWLGIYGAVGAVRQSPEYRAIQAGNALRNTLKMMSEREAMGVVTANVVHSTLRNQLITECRRDHLFD